MTEKELQTILSINIKRYRSFRKFTQAEFAEKVEISIPFLSDIENCKKWVSPKTLTKMAAILEIEVYELFKPEKILPDTAGNIIEQYSAEIYSVFGEALDNLRTDYINSLPKK